MPLSDSVYAMGATDNTFSQPISVTTRRRGSMEGRHTVVPIACALGVCQVVRGCQLTVLSPLQKCWRAANAAKMPSQMRGQGLTVRAMQLRCIRGNLHAGGAWHTGVSNGHLRAQTPLATEVVHVATYHPGKDSGSR